MTKQGVRVGTGIALAGGRSPVRIGLCALAVLVAPSAAWAQAGGREVNSIDVTPTMNVTYDSNVFQLNSSRFNGPRDDVVFTPAVNVRVNRTIGRNSLTASGNFGYDFHNRYNQLNQANIAASASGQAALTAYCVADPSANLSVRQNNFAGVGAFRNSQTTQDYAVTVACQRPVGFFPSVTLGYQSNTNSNDFQSLFNQHTFRVSGGIGYALPSLGSLLVSGGISQIRQPNRRDIAGGEGSDVKQIGLTLNRAVAPRISFSAGLRYLSVDPLRATAPSYSGLGYNASVNYHPSPRLSVIATADRDVTGTGDIAVSYVLASTYGVTGVYTISPRTSVTLSGQYFNQRYRGENPIYFPILRGYERGETVRANLGHSLGQRIQLGAFASYTNVNAGNDFYAYNRYTVGGSAGVRF